MGEREMLKPADVAAMLGCTTGAVYARIRNGQLPAVRQGRSIFVPRAAWEEWLRRQSELALVAVGGGGGHGAVEALSR